MRPKLFKIVNEPGRWYTPAIPVLRSLRLEDCEFESSLDYKVRLYHKNKQANKQTKHSYQKQESLRNCHTLERRG
jgi:hypothetical protein